MYFLSKMGIFHGYVCLPKCNWILRISELDIKLVQSVIGNHKPEITSSLLNFCIMSAFFFGGVFATTIHTSQVGNQKMIQEHNID